MMATIPISGRDGSGANECDNFATAVAVRLTLLAS